MGKAYIKETTWCSVSSFIVMKMFIFILHNNIIYMVTKSVAKQVKCFKNLPTMHFMPDELFCNLTNV